MTETNKQNTGFLGGVFTAFLLILFIYTFQQTSNSFEQKKLLEEQASKIADLQKQISDIPKIPEEKIAFPDYYVATQEMKKVTPIENQSSYVNLKTQEIVGSQEIVLTGSGKIARGYLLVNAVVDNNRPLTIYDSVYLKLNLVGGHLLRNGSIKTPASSGTTLLYPLNNIPYLANIPYDENRSGRMADWVSILNNTNKPVLLSFVSTARQGGIVKKVVIAYECAEETPNCEITFTN